MAIGGIAEILFGVKAEQRQLEDIAEPLTAEPDRERRRSRLSFGPGTLSSARAMSVAGPHPDVPLEREIEIIGRALEDRGSADRRELARRVGARYWGPGRFRAALREAVDEGSVKRLRGGEYAPAGKPAEHAHDRSR